MDPKATTVRLQDPAILRRLWAEKAEQDRSIRALVCIALLRYFKDLDTSRSLEGGANTPA